MTAPDAGYPPDPAARAGFTPKKWASFWSRVDKADDCWRWTGTSSRGYGTFYVGDKKVRMAHRLAYEYVVGLIPDGLQLDHLCRNRICVNPAHLEPVTGRENTMRGESFSPVNASKTHCPHGHPYAGENIVPHEGRRRCRTCRNSRERAKYHHERGHTPTADHSAAWWAGVAQDHLYETCPVRKRSLAELQRAGVDRQGNGAVDPLGTDICGWCRRVWISRNLQFALTKETPDE